MRSYLFLALIVATAGCGSVAEDNFDAGRDVTDAGAPIDAGLLIDAGIGATDAGGIPRTKVSEITSGAGRVSGSVYTVDVQIGHGHGQGATMGSAFSVEGASAIKP